MSLIALYMATNYSSSNCAPQWILAYGGVGLVLGLALYGYKV